MGGFGFGCGPCGGYGNEGFDNKYFDGACCGADARDSVANVQENCFGKRRQVYWENEECFGNNKVACCADRRRNAFNNWNNGGRARGYGGWGNGCGIGYGGCGVGCGPRVYGAAPCDGVRRGLGYRAYGKGL